MPNWIRESNLIENIDDPHEDQVSEMAWNICTMSDPKRWKSK